MIKTDKILREENYLKALEKEKQKIENAIKKQQDVIWELTVQHLNDEEAVNTYFVIDGKEKIHFDNYQEAKKRYLQCAGNCNIINAITGQIVL